MITKLPKTSTKIELHAQHMNSQRNRYISHLAAPLWSSAPLVAAVPAGIYICRWRPQAHRTHTGLWNLQHTSHPRFKQTVFLHLIKQLIISLTFTALFWSVCAFKRYVKKGDVLVLKQLFGLGHTVRLLLLAKHILLLHSNLSSPHCLCDLKTHWRPNCGFNELILFSSFASFGKMVFTDLVKIACLLWWTHIRNWTITFKTFVTNNI